MKKHLVSEFVGIFLSLAISVTAKGQFILSKSQTSKEVTTYVRSVEKDAAAQGYRNDINVRAVRHFLRNFDNVSNEAWYDAPEMFVVTFTLNDINYRVDYDKQGGWIETFRTYDETKLLPDIRDIIVKSSYRDYKIFQVQEIQLRLHPINYIIHMEGKTNLINVRIYDGEIQECEKFEKSK